MNDINKFKGHSVKNNDTRQITAKEYNSDNRPTYLYYDIISTEGDGSAVEEILCKDKETYNKLQRIFKNEKMELSLTFIENDPE